MIYRSAPNSLTIIVC